MRVSTVDIQRQNVRNITTQQSRLQETQNKISAGKRMLKPSDDPIGSTRSIQLREELGHITRLQANVSDAERRLNLEETTIAGMVDIMDRVKSLTLQAANGTLSQGERKSIAVEVDQSLKQLVDFANFVGPNGEHLFAGFQGGEEPYRLDAQGRYQYHGDEGQRFVQVGLATQVAVSDSGRSFLANLDAAYETFTTAADKNNSGDGVISLGQVSNIQDWQASTASGYTVLFNSTVPLTYDVVSDDNPTVPLAGFDNIPYTSGDEITVAGIKFTISGTPQAGDKFVLKQSTKTDVFSTMQQLVNDLNTFSDSGGDMEKLNYSLSLALENLDSATVSIVNTQANVGARANAIDVERDTNDNFILISQQALSKVEDLDYAEAISDLTMQSFILQATQQSLVKTQGISLFDYIR